MTTRVSILATILLLYGCSSAPPAPDTPATALELPSAPASGQLEYQLVSGTYRCDGGLRVEVRREPNDARRIQVGWTGRLHQLERNPSHSGLPRYEDARSGLVWIELPWKGVLLDGHLNKPLASECTLG
jgi:hypothetical protein